MRRKVRKRVYKEAEPVTDLRAITNGNFKRVIHGDQKTNPRGEAMVTKITPWIYSTDPLRKLLYHIYVMCARWVAPARF